MLPSTLQFLIVIIGCAINERLQKALDYKSKEARSSDHTASTTRSSTSYSTRTASPTTSTECPGRYRARSV
jgi:hypothetical protein